MEEIGKSIISFIAILGIVISSLVCGLNWHSSVGIDHFYLGKRTLVIPNEGER